MTEPNFNFCEAKMQTSLVTSSVQTPYPSPWPGGPGLAHYVAPPLPGQIRFAGLCPGIYLSKLHIPRPGPEGQGLLITLHLLFRAKSASLSFAPVFICASYISFALVQRPRAHSFHCVSFPNETHFVGLSFGFFYTNSTFSIRPECRYLHIGFLFCKICVIIYLNIISII